jgi:hypothetical protein
MLGARGRLHLLVCEPLVQLPAGEVSPASLFPTLRSARPAVPGASPALTGRHRIIGRPCPSAQLPMCLCLPFCRFARSLLRLI